MARVILRRGAPGYRTVRGEVVRRMQSELRDAGWDPGELDGIFGGDTELALRQFQQQHDLDDPAAGLVTDEIWQLLMREEVPTLFDRCLQITADFEGQGFDRPAGNFDGAGLTWGIIGFTLANGEVQEILRAIARTDPLALPRAFGPLHHELLSAMSLSLEEQVAWADGISVGTRKGRLRPEWDAAFKSLGQLPGVRRIQLERARQKYWARATRDARRFGLESEMGWALCFDIAVQNGGIDVDVEGPRIQQWIGRNPAAPESERRIAIADVVARNSRPQYAGDVRARKLILATGEGEVHAARYVSADWGLDEVPVQRESPALLLR